MGAYYLYVIYSKKSKKYKNSHILYDNFFYCLCSVF